MISNPFAEVVALSWRSNNLRKMDSRVDQYLPDILSRIKEWNYFYQNISLWPEKEMELAEALKIEMDKDKRTGRLNLDDICKVEKIFQSIKIQSFNIITSEYKCVTGQVEPSGKIKTGWIWLGVVQASNEWEEGRPTIYFEGSFKAETPIADQLVGLIGEVKDGVKLRSDFPVKGLGEELRILQPGEKVKITEKKTFGKITNSPYNVWAKIEVIK